MPSYQLRCHLQDVAPYEIVRYLFDIESIVLGLHLFECDIGCCQAFPNHHLQWPQETIETIENE